VLRWRCKGLPYEELYMIADHLIAYPQGSLGDWQLSMLQDRIYVASRVTITPETAYPPPVTLVEHAIYFFLASYPARCMPDLQYVCKNRGPLHPETSCTDECFPANGRSMNHAGTSCTRTFICPSCFWRVGRAMEELAHPPGMAPPRSERASMQDSLNHTLS